MDKFLTGFLLGVLLISAAVLGVRVTGDWLPRCDMSNMTPEHCYSVSVHPEGWRRDK